MQHTHLTRRGFALGLTSGAFAGLALSGCGRMALGGPTAAAALAPDPAGLIDLRPGFSYRVISSLGERMSDGRFVPDHADGMGAFRIDGRRMTLVRNHELTPRHFDTGPLRASGDQSATFDRDREGRPLPGGTTTLVYDYRSGKVEEQYLSLAGTIRNCSGGATPWGSWLTCEEDVSRAGSNGLAHDHGWVVEVPAVARGVVEPRPLKTLGRFNHEAAAVDPRTGVVYLTEDRDDGLFYGFPPDTRGALARGGRLQALAFEDLSRPADNRNWDGAGIARGERVRVRWVALDVVGNPDDDLRQRGHTDGAVLFAPGEGVHPGRGEIYFCCTSGGAAKLSQIMRYGPSRFEGQAGEPGEPGTLELFVKATDPSMLNFGDNLTVAPNGYLIVCEDQYTDPVENHLRGVTTGASSTTSRDSTLRPSWRARASRRTAAPCSSTSIARPRRSRSLGRGGRCPPDFRASPGRSDRAGSDRHNSACARKTRRAGRRRPRRTPGRPLASPRTRRGA